jgi:hypothetical protein
MLANELVAVLYRNYREGSVKKNRGGGRYDRDVMTAWIELD